VGLFTQASRRGWLLREGPGANAPRHKVEVVGWVFLRRFAGLALGTGSSNPGNQAQPRAGEIGGESGR